MEILSSASSSEKIWTKRRRNPFGLCVGCMASANRLLLLHYAGYGAGGSGRPVCYLYFTGDYLEQFAGVPAFLGIVILISCIADWMIFAKIEVE